MKRRPTERQCRDFGVLMTLLCLVVFTVHVVRGALWHDTPMIWLEAALVLVPLTFGAPEVFAAPCGVFLSVGHALNRILIPILLVPFFFFVITPFGVVARLVGWDPMRRKKGSDAASFWEDPREDERGMERYKQPF